MSFANNLLSGLPIEMGSLVSLKTLDVSKNQLQWLPNEVGSLSNLEHFDIRNNQIDYLPVELEALSSNLQVLLVEGNDIKDPVRIFDDFSFLMFSSSGPRLT